MTNTRHGLRSVGGGPGVAPGDFRVECSCGWRYTTNGGTTFEAFDRWAAHVADRSLISAVASGSPPITRHIDGVDLIAAERNRQIAVEHFTPEHDDAHNTDELACAAACYALPAHIRAVRSSWIEALWPWDDEDWKPGDRIRELTKAGALIAAEIDRMRRADAKVPTVNPPGVWRHTRPVHSHQPDPDMSRVYLQRGTRQWEAPCRGCANAEVVVFHEHNWLPEAT